MRQSERRVPGLRLRGRLRPKVAQGSRVLLLLLLTLLRTFTRWPLGSSHNRTRDHLLHPQKKD
jgi:hypothetical protein